MSTHAYLTRVALLSLLVTGVSASGTVSWAGEARSARGGGRTDAYAMGHRPHTSAKPYRCPRCGMTYDKPGVCPMDNTKLKKVTTPSKSG